MKTLVQQTIEKEQRRYYCEKWNIGCIHRRIECQPVPEPFVKTWQEESCHPRSELESRRPEISSSCHCSAICKAKPSQQKVERLFVHKLLICGTWSRWRLPLGFQISLRLQRTVIR